MYDDEEEDQEQAAPSRSVTPDENAEGDEKEQDVNLALATHSGWYCELASERASSI